MVRSARSARLPKGQETTREPACKAALLACNHQCCMMCCMQDCQEAWQDLMMHNLNVLVACNPPVLVVTSLANVHCHADTEAPACYQAALAYNGLHALKKGEVHQLHLTTGHAS